MKKGISQLTANLQQCQELVLLGINAPAFFWHGQDEKLEGEVWEVAQYLAPKPSEKLVPAWTKEELDTMIGPDWPKPDFWKPSEVGKQNPLSYPVAYPDKMKVFASGAEASADVLIYLINQQRVDPYKANSRYIKVFQP